MSSDPLEALPQCPFCGATAMRVPEGITCSAPLSECGMGAWMTEEQWNRRAAYEAAKPAPAAVGQEVAEFNVNNHVYVKLTEIGRKAHQNHWARYGCNDVPIKTDADGWSEFQLWEVMAIFGERMGNGFPVPFETTIRLKTGGANG